MMETEHNFTDGFTEDLIRETLLDPDKGFRYKAPVVCESLQIKRVLTLQLKLLNLKSTKNTFGTYDGTKPHIQTIISKTGCR